MHTAFLKEKKRKDNQWKLDVQRGDNEAKVKELRNKVVMKMTNEEIFMASSVKQKLEKLSKGKSSQFRKPFVAWDEDISSMKMFRIKKSQATLTQARGQR